MDRTKWTSFWASTISLPTYVPGVFFKGHDFSQDWGDVIYWRDSVFSTHFRKISNIKFYQNPSSGSQVVPYGRTDRQKLIVAFCNFANAPKMTHILARFEHEISAFTWLMWYCLFSLIIVINYQSSVEWVANRSTPPLLGVTASLVHPIFVSWRIGYGDAVTLIVNNLWLNRLYVFQNFVKLFLISVHKVSLVSHLVFFCVDIQLKGNVEEVH